MPDWPAFVALGVTESTSRKATKREARVRSPALQRTSPVRQCLLLLVLVTILALGLHRFELRLLLRRQEGQDLVALGFADLLKDSDHTSGDAKALRYIQNILSSGRNLLDLINDLLDLAKIEAGRMEIRSEPLSLNDLFDLLIIPRLLRSTLLFFHF